MIRNARDQAVELGDFIDLFMSGWTTTTGGGKLAPVCEGSRPMFRLLVAIACLGATLLIGDAQAGQDECAWIGRIEDANLSRILEDAALSRKLENVECLRNPKTPNCARIAEQRPPSLEEDRLKRIKALPIDQEKKALLRSRRIWIGATDELACLAWGKPKNVKRTTTRSMVYEQWVYSSGNYLYFENGVLTTIQN